jgi:hypothetical protein
MMLGIVLLSPKATFDNNANFAFMAQMATESTWSVGLFLFGFFRICGLIINGSMEGATSVIRTLGAVTGFMIFFMIGFSMIVSWLVLGNAPSTGLAMYIPACGAEIAAIICASHDARVYQNGRGRSTS